MAMQEIGHESSMKREGRDEIRTELFRIVDELTNARADQAPKLRARFDQLWADLGSHGDATVH
jgi:hypothetical protein